VHTVPRLSALSGDVVNAMSVDVEEYFHVSALAAAAPVERWHAFESRVVQSTERLLAIFADAGVRATFFVLGWVAERQPSLVRRIASLGHELASHGYAHRLVYEQDPESFRADVHRARRVIEDVAGERVLGYRAPSYSITRRSLWALDVLVEEGHVYDASIFPVYHDRYGIPGAPRHPYRVETLSGRSLVELPPTTIRLGCVNLPVAGGGYFRLLPYWWTRWGLSRLNRRERRPAIFYLHPWEVDPEQPRLPSSPLNRLRHYRNLHCTEPRLGRMLRDFAFGPIRDVFAEIMGGGALARVPVRSLAPGKVA
jgi:polysaccharide deacetylase family protein (PEP-CTERM system associated)